MIEDQPERLKRAIQAGCSAVGPQCSYPACRCTQTPLMIREALKEWDAQPDLMPVYGSKPVE